MNKQYRPVRISAIFRNRYRGQNFAPDVFIWRILVMSLACVFAFSSLQPQHPVHGQIQDTLLVQAPDISGFPLLTVEIKIPGTIHPIEDKVLISQLEVLEGGQDVTVQSLERATRGVHFTLAINGGRELDLRDSEGVSNFTKLRGVLRDWAVSREFSGRDAWSLETNEGRRVANAENPEEWLDALESYEPNFRTMTSDMESLNAAIRYAAGRVVPFGVDKAVLFVTTAPAVNQVEEIKALGEEARSAGIRVSVWMVGDPLFLSNDQGGALMSLTEITGGSFFHFTGTQPLPDAGNLLSNLGFLYVLQYESLIRQAGTYPLKITAHLADLSYQGNSPPFYIEVLPPKPVLVNPPSIIHRAANGKMEVTSESLIDGRITDSLLPDSVKVTYQVDYPDGYPRQIVTSRLIVNGVVVALNDSPPFNEFDWDLSKFVQSGEQIIQIEISDSLGLTGITREYPVRVVVDLPEPDQKPSALQIGFVLGGILLGLGTLLLVVWGAARLIKVANLRQLKDILLGATRKEGEGRTALTAKTERIFATLVPSGVLKDDWEEGAIRVTKMDGIFGSEPDQVDYQLLADSVDGMQARLILREGKFWLQDLNSALGTWVNYVRIGTEPERVHPGDLIHFGNCEFRFTMIDRSPKDSAQISPYEPYL